MPSLARMSSPAVLLLCLALGACASGGAGRPRADLITAAQLEEGHFTTVYDAVRALRPAWLSTRGQDSFTSPSEVQVYLDGVRLGDVNELRGVPVAGVEHLRYYTPAQATSRWGAGHGAGAIYISSFAPEGSRRQER